MMRPDRAALLAIAAAAATGGALASGASGGTAPQVGPCPGSPPRATDLVTGAGWLESSLVDRDGRLLFTSQARSALMVIDRRGARPRVLAGGIASPGGIAQDPRSGRIFVGFGNNVANGKLAPAQGKAGLYSVDPRSGRRRLFATGLSMANGVARAPDGTFYASDDFAPSIDRVTPRGRVTRAWAKVANANGLALDARGRYLYANVSYPSTRIVRIDTRRPSAVADWAVPPAGSAGAFLDGLSRDSRGRLFAASFGAGQVWRSDGRGRLCALASGLATATSTALGRGRRGFAPGNLYVTTAGGRLVELRGGAR